MSARSKARKRALDVLFEADQRDHDPLTTLGEWLSRADPPVPVYAEDLVRGVAEHAARIDEVLAGYTADWSLDRLPSVDRAILRLATYELLWSGEVPAPVAIDEAVELAKSLSTDASPGFVNGVLARVLADREQLVVSPPAPEFPPTTGDQGVAGGSLP